MKKYWIENYGQKNYEGQMSRTEWRVEADNDITIISSRFSYGLPSQSAKYQWNRKTGKHELLHSDYDTGDPIDEKHIARGLSLAAKHHRSIKPKPTKQLTPTETS